MELKYLQNDKDLRNKFQNVDINNCLQNYMNLEKFPKLGAHAKQIMTLFGSTYVFLAIKIIKTDHRCTVRKLSASCCVVYICNYRPINGKEAIPNLSLNSLFRLFIYLSRFF